MRAIDLGYDRVIWNANDFLMHRIDFCKHYGIEQIQILNRKWSSLDKGDESCIGPSDKLLCLWQTQNNLCRTGVAKFHTSLTVGLHCNPNVTVKIPSECSDTKQIKKLHYLIKCKHCPANYLIIAHTQVNYSSHQSLKSNKPGTPIPIMFDYRCIVTIKVPGFGTLCRHML